MHPLLKNPTRPLKRAMAKALEKGVKYWHSEYLWMHFDRTAYYRYRDRSRGLYLQRTEYVDPETGEKTDTVPLHETGATRSRAQSTPHTDADQWAGINATSTKATVKFTVPSYIGAVADNTEFKPYQEMVTLNEQEKRKIWKVVHGEIENQMNLISGQFSGYLQGGGVHLGGLL